MAGIEFTLDFTKWVTEQHLPTYKQALAEYLQCGIYPNKISFRGKKKGVYCITVFDEIDAAKLEGKNILYRYGHKLLKDVKVRFERQPPWKFLRNPKWLTVDGLPDTGLILVTNESLDNFFSQYGVIIVPTQDDREEHGIMNGRKKLRIDLNTGISIPRNLEITMRVAEMEQEGGDQVFATGKVRIFYKDQPVWCRECAQYHTTRCPEREVREAKAKVEEDERHLEINAYIVSDSNGRYLNKTATRAEIDVVTGAKIGQLLNAVNQKEDCQNYNAVVFNVGQNNITQEEDASLEYWKDLQKPQIEQLKEAIMGVVKSGRSVIIMKVPKTEATTKTDHVKSQRDFLNKTFDIIAVAINHNYFKKQENADKDQNDPPVKVVDGEMEGDDVEKYDDRRHISKLNCEARIIAVADALKNKLQPGLIRIGHKLTVEKKYSAVNSYY